MGFTHQHACDKGYIYKLNRFAVKFKGKENYSVGYGRNAGKNNKNNWIVLATINRTEKIGSWTNLWVHLILSLKQADSG